ncbi:uncharacterized protein [Ptychodera flava]|uniref:uncharacterized protein n=1 Tax=Ptychodera flava TaxID=63121 RepID=UPI00396A8DC0
MAARYNPDDMLKENGGKARSSGMWYQNPSYLTDDNTVEVDIEDNEPLQTNGFNEDIKAFDGTGWTSLSELQEWKKGQDTDSYKKQTKRMAIAWIITATVLVVFLIVAIPCVILLTGSTAEDVGNATTTAPLTTTLKTTVFMSTAVPIQQARTFDGRMTITSSKWDDDLDNPSSDAYQELATNVTTTLDLVYGESDDYGDTYNGSEVIRFERGSVVCYFNLTFYTNDELDEELIEQELEDALANPNRTYPIEIEEGSVSINETTPIIETTVAPTTTKQVTTRKTDAPTTIGPTPPGGTVRTTNTPTPARTTSEPGITTTTVGGTTAAQPSLASTVATTVAGATPGPGETTAHGGTTAAPPSPASTGATTVASATPGPGETTAHGGTTVAQPSPVSPGATTAASATPGPGETTADGGTTAAQPSPASTGATTAASATPGPGETTADGGTTAAQPSPASTGATTVASATPGPGETTADGGTTAAQPSPATTRATTAAVATSPLNTTVSMSTDVPTEQARTFDGRMTITSSEWDNDLANSSSDAYQELAANVTTTLDLVYGESYEDTYNGSEVIKFERGSVVCYFNLTFYTNDELDEELIEQELEDALANPNRTYPIEIEEGSVSINETTPIIETTVAPNTTTEVTTRKTDAPTTIGPTPSSGTVRTTNATAPAGTTPGPGETTTADNGTTAATPSPASTGATTAVGATSGLVETTAPDSGSTTPEPSTLVNATSSGPEQTTTPDGGIGSTSEPGVTGTTAQATTVRVTEQTTPTLNSTTSGDASTPDGQTS